MKILPIMEINRNQFGENEMASFGKWKAACKKAHPGVWFDGDKDIAQALVGPKPYVRGETKGVGEWDGERGTVNGNAHLVKESSISLEEAKAKLAELEHDYKSLPTSRHTQEQTDAMDEMKQEIDDLKAYIKTLGVNEGSQISAANAYEARTNQIQGLLQDISKKLESHAGSQQGSPDSWGHAGDLAYVAEQLEAILEFLS